MSGRLLRPVNSTVLTLVAVVSLLLGALAVVVLPAANAAAPVEPDLPGIVVGTLESPDDAPLVDARVDAVPVGSEDDSDAWTTTYTDEGGTQYGETHQPVGGYRVALPEGSYKLRIWVDGADEPVWYGGGAGTAVTVDAGDYLDLGTTELAQPDVDVSTVSGVVVDADGAAMADAWVNLYRKFDRRGWRSVSGASTDGDGSFSLEGARRGVPLTVCVYGDWDQYCLGEEGAGLPDGDGFEIPVANDGSFPLGVDLVVPEVTVTVPVEGESGGLSFLYLTNADGDERYGQVVDGVATFSGVLPGAGYTVCGYVSVGQLCLGGADDYPGADKFTVPAGQSTFTAPTFSFPAMGTVSGVVETADETPVADVRITFYEFRDEPGLGEGYFQISTANTDADGEFEVTRALADQEHLALCVSGFTNGLRCFTPAGGEPGYLGSTDFALTDDEPSVTLAAPVVVPEPTRITGTVELAGGDPAAGEWAEIYVDGDGYFPLVGSAQTDDDGRYSVPMFGTGDVTACVWSGARTCLGGAESPEEADLITVDGTSATVELDTLVLTASLNQGCGAVHDNGTTAIGLGCRGELGFDPDFNGEYVGLRQSGGTDVVAYGCVCEGWGVGDAATGSSGYVSENEGWTDLQLEGFASDPETGSASSTVSAADETFRVTHEIVEGSPTSDAYVIRVSVTNISEDTAQLRYRRAVDFDLAPVWTNEFVTVDDGDRPEIAFSSNDGFASLDPFGARTSRGATGSFTEYGPADQGTLLDFDFGALDPLQTKEFTLAYGVAESQAQATASLAELDASAYALAVGTSNGIDADGEAAFLAYDIGGELAASPTAVRDDVEIDTGDSIAITPLTNDTDPNDEALTLVSTTQPDHGSVVCVGGTCTYAHDGGPSTTDSFTYVVRNESGRTAVGTVRISINRVDLPVDSVIYGQVVDENGRGVDGALVEAYYVYDGDNAVTSDTTHEGGDFAHGYFELDVAAGDYDLHVTAPDGDDRYGASWHGTFDVGAEDEYDVGRLHLRVEDSLFRGTVRGPGGHGVDGIEVTAWADDDSTDPVASALTYGSRGGDFGHGYYELWGLTAGEDYTIHFHDPEGRFDDVDYRGGDLVRARHGVKTLNTVRMAPEGAYRSIGGMVQSIEGGIVEDATVRLYRVYDDYAVSVATTSTDAYGEFTFDSRWVGRTFTVCAWVYDGDRSCLGGGSDPEQADTFVLTEGSDTYELWEALVVTPPCAGRIISNGTVSLGVNCTGELNVPTDDSEGGTTPGVGVQYDETGNDATYPGCTCEGWGVADGTTEVVGWANTDEGDSGNLEVVDFTADEDSATSTVQVGDTYLITHDYEPSADTDNAYAVTVTVENISDEPTDLRYRRVMDWDIEPTAFDEYSTIQTGDSEEVVYTSDDGFASSDPLSGPSEILESGDFVDSGPTDHGALFDFAFGTLLPGESKTFQTYYGAAGDEAGAMEALVDIGAEAYSLGQPSDDGTEETAGNPLTGTPNTFLFAFSGVGGSAVTPPVAGDDTFRVARNSSGNVLAVLANDTDPDGDALRVFANSDAAHGEVSCGRLTCTYTPVTGYTGPDSFTYTVTDGRGGFDTATVTLDVTSLVAGNNTGLPTFSPAPRVGTTVTASPGTWDSSGLTYRYAWLRDGNPIESADATDGNATYTPVAADLGHDLSVAVTASKAGLADVTAESNDVAVTAGAAATNTSLPAISGLPRFGERLTALPGTWTPTPGRYAYQWLRDSVAIPGATADSYVPVGADIGHSLRVRVTARTTGHTDGSAQSAAVTVSAAPAPRNVASPSISGVAALGRTLTAHPGTWSEPGYTLDFHYQWLRNGTEIGGATGSTYVVAAPVVEGDDIRVRVTADLSGHQSGVATSGPVTVGSVAGTNTALPTITGTPRVGETLTYHPGTWTPTGLSLGHVWVASWGTSGYRWVIQTGGTTFAVPAWLSGYTVWVEETASGAPGTAPASATSAPTAAIQDIPRLYADSIGYSQIPKAGQTLSVTGPDWYTWDDTGRHAASGVGQTVDWYVDWQLVASNTASLPLTEAMAGKYVYAVVSGTKAGHHPGVVYGPSQRIRRTSEASTTLTLTVKRAEAPFTAVPGASVSACETSGWECVNGTTGPGGVVELTLTGTPTGVAYQVQVYPPYETGLFEATSTVTVRTGTTNAAEIRLKAPTPIPPTADLSNTIGEREVPGGGTYPVVYVGTSSTLSIEGCAGIDDPRWTVTFASGATPMTGSLVETPAGGGTSSYAATLPGYTSTGKATISTNIVPCGDDEPVEFSLYIDPSGVVTDQYGRTIAGAEVTLLHLDGGAFVPVPDGSTVMSADNRHNPSYTDGVGFFRWDVLDGTYKVSVTQATSGGATCDVTTTGPMAVPPPRLDLLVKTNCTGATAPAPTTTPVITGNRRVGQTLSVSHGAWADGLQYVGTEWLSGGAVVGTGDHYTVAADDLGEQVTARITVRRPDYRQENGLGDWVSFAPTHVDVLSGTIAAAAGGGGGGGGGGDTAPVNTAAPSIAGVAKVGQTLTANPGTWSTTGLSFAYRWLRDGVAIDGATGTSYVPVAADLGKAVSVRVTASKAGVPDGTATSAPTTIGIGNAPQALSPPVITGDTDLGSVLTVSKGSWDVDDLTFGYQWLREGEPIPGATGSTYTVKAADLGTSVSALVTVTKAGYAEGSAAAGAVTIPDGGEPGTVTSTTTVSLVDDSIKAGQRGKLRVTVARSDGDVASGRVVIRVAGERVKTVGLNAKGRALVELPKLKPGVHKISATYRGEEDVEASTSDVVKLKVTRKKGGHHRVPSIGLRISGIF